MHLRMLALCVVLAGVLPASASAQWAPADEATIHPGVMTFTAGGQCTANFVFTQGANVYIGQAAHCSSTSGSTSTNGCIANSLPNGTQVEIDGASRPGVMVYNSWNAMKAAGEQANTNSEQCRFNDFALVQIDPADVGNVNPSVPFWGGPQGVGVGNAGERTYTYGNSSLRGGATALSPKTGQIVSRSAGGWSYTVYTATPGIPGDSGSAFLTRTGAAMGTLSTVAVAPLAGSNGVGAIDKELAYAQTHGFSGLTLVGGTEPFSPAI